MKDEMLKELNEKIQNHFLDEELVFGEGALGSIMLIGEAPGKNEILQRRAFVGKAGENLAEFLKVLGLKREEIYITNTVKKRPFKVSEKGTISNRKPTAKEIAEFKPFLLDEIELVKPRLIVTLGSVPISTLLGEVVKMGDIAGKPLKKDGLNIFPLYHPASIIYNRALKEVYDKHLLVLKEYIKNN